MSSALGNQFRKIRIDKQVTMGRLSVAMDTSSAQVSQVECGKSIPSDDYIDRFIAAMDVAAEKAKELRVCAYMLRILNPKRNRYSDESFEDFSLKEKILFQAVRDHETGCWNWNGSKDENGYGSVSHKGQQYRAHRVSWQIWNNQEIGELYACHKCDNPSCVNPEHLFVGDARDNAIDMMNKFRAVQGEESPNAKLTAKDVFNIRKRVAAGESQRNLAAEYGVSHNTIHLIYHKKTWKRT